MDNLAFQLIPEKQLGFGYEKKQKENGVLSRIILWPKIWRKEILEDGKGYFKEFL